MLKDHELSKTEMGVVNVARSMGGWLRGCGHCLGES